MRTTRGRDTPGPLENAALRILITIPVYNEASTLRDVIDRVLEQASGEQTVLVVNDGSTDGTTELLEQDGRVRVLSHAMNLGYGRSLIDAFDWAHERGFDWVVTMDCDDQHEPGELPRFFEAIARDTHDLISGSRYLHAVDTGSAPADRRRINMELTREINDRLGPSLLGAGGELLTDSFCGFKAHRTSVTRALELDAEGYAFPMQLWVRAAAHGLRVRELPVSLIYNDPNRSFGAALDDPDRRRAHYLSVLHREILRCADRLPASASVAVGCR